MSLRSADDSSPDYENQFGPAEDVEETMTDEEANQAQIGLGYDLPGEQQPEDTYEPPEPPAAQPERPDPFENDDPFADDDDDSFSSTSEPTPMPSSTSGSNSSSGSSGKSDKPSKTKTSGKTGKSGNGKSGTGSQPGASTNEPDKGLEIDDVTHVAKKKKGTGWGAGKSGKSGSSSGSSSVGKTAGTGWGTGSSSVGSTSKQGGLSGFSSGGHVGGPGLDSPGTATTTFDPNTGGQTINFGGSTAPINPGPSAGHVGGPGLDSPGMATVTPNQGTGGTTVDFGGATTPINPAPPAGHVGGPGLDQPGIATTTVNSGTGATTIDFQEDSAKTGSGWPNSPAGSSPSKSQGGRPPSKGPSQDPAVEAETAELDRLIARDAKAVEDLKETIAKYDKMSEDLHNQIDDLVNVLPMPGGRVEQKVFSSVVGNVAKGVESLTGYGKLADTYRELLTLEQAQLDGFRNQKAELQKGSKGSGKSP